MLRALAAALAGNVQKVEVIRSGLEARAVAPRCETLPSASAGADDLDRNDDTFHVTHEDHSPSVECCSFMARILGCGS